MTQRPVSVVGTYICEPGVCSRVHVSYERPDDRDGVCWHDSAFRRLQWQGGPSEAANDDVAAWKRLGAGKRAAA